MIARPFKSLFLAASLLMVSPVQADDNVIAAIDFKNPQETRQWYPVNDGVMGGRSSGGPDFRNGHLIFAGSINTNGGGFSSIRREISAGDMRGVTAVAMRVKSDGRAYRLRFRTDVTWRGRRIAFQKAIPQTRSGQWETVTLSLDNMRASLFGRTVRGAKFAAEDIIETGFILADGQDGPFRLEVDWIAFK